MKKRFNNKRYKKAKVINDNDLQLRVLYKKVGLAPEIKIIKDIENFKRSIILDKLDIIPYKHVFIICNNQKYKMQMPINVFFSLYHIAGDLIGREPKKIQENNNTKARIAKNNNYAPFERDIEEDSAQVNLRASSFSTKQPNFEKTVIHILVNIEMILANLLKNR